MKNISRRIIAVILTLALVFAFNTVAFASGDTVTLTVVNDKVETTQTISNVSIGSLTTVDDVVAANFTTSWTHTPLDTTWSPICDPNDPLYGSDTQANILISLNGYASDPYVPSSAVQPWSTYVYGTDDVLDYYYDLYPQYQGIGMWYGYGYAFMGDMQHMIYIGWDWTYTVNGTRPGKSTGNPNIYDGYFEYYMNEALLHDGDEVELLYSHHELVFQ